MSRLTIDVAQSSRLQTLPNSARDLRPIGNSGAGAFGDLFAEKLAPYSEQPVETEAAEESPESTEETSDSDETENESESDTDGQSDSEESASQQQPGGSNTDDEAGSPESEEADASQSTAANPSADASSDDASSGDAGAATDVVSEAPEASPDLAAASAQGAAISGQAQVEQELKNAAVVDLSSMARAEMLGQVEGSRPQPPQADAPNTAAQPKPVPVPGPTVTPAPSDFGVGRSQQDGVGLPNPSQAPPLIVPESQSSSHGANGSSFGKRPYRGDHPISAPGVARVAGDPPGDAKQQTNAVVSKVAFLDQLVNKSAARRGAVASVDRIAHSSEPGPAQQRASMLKPIETANPARDAFLSPVQRGLGKLIAEGGGKMTVMLRPRELGDVRIAMETERGAVRVQMEASSEAARKTLESGLETLRSSLESRGVRVDSMEVTNTGTPHGSDSNQNGANRDRDKGHQNQPGNASDQHRAEGQSDDQSQDTTRGIWTDLGIDAVA